MQSGNRGVGMKKWDDHSMIFELDEDEISIWKGCILNNDLL